MTLRERVEKSREQMEQYVQQYGTPTGLALRDSHDVLEFVKQNKIDSIRLWFTDLLGFLKSFSVSPTELTEAFAYGMGFDGSSILGYKRVQEGDMVAFPLAETAQLIPFKIGGSKAIRMFTSVYTPANEAYESDTRQVLKRNLQRLLQYDLTHMNIGPEAEYFYFRNSSVPEGLDSAGYFDLNPVDEGDSLREATMFALRSMNIRVEYSHHEVAPSQHEIDLKYTDALTMADNLQTHKWLVKEMARINGVHATFMPKPLRDVNGSGMHIHLSLFRDARNAFYSAEDQYNLSPLAGQFLTGILRHSKEVCLLTNQWFNSYKRLVPGFEAPVYIAWAERNRSVLVRIPAHRKDKEVATRIEIRFPDAACNPYLAFASLLTAGLKGIDNSYELPPPVMKDLYIMSDLDREREHIESLPHDLYAAIQQAEQSELLRETLGEELTLKLLETKYRDWREHSLSITPRELRDNLLL